MAFSPLPIPSALFQHRPCHNVVAVRAIPAVELLTLHGGGLTLVDLFFLFLACPLLALLLFVFLLLALQLLGAVLLAALLTLDPGLLVLGLFALPLLALLLFRYFLLSILLHTGLTVRNCDHNRVMAGSGLADSRNAALQSLGTHNAEAGA